MACYRFIELNPVRAGMMEHPGEYRWSSYLVNAQAEMPGLVRPQPPYLALGLEREQRLQVYRELFRAHLKPGLVEQIRSATNGNDVLRSSRFSEEVAAQCLGEE